MKKKNLIQIWLVIYMFCLIYAPPIFYKVNFLFFQSILTSILILLNYRKCFASIILNKKIKKFYFLILCAFCYVFCITIIGYFINPVNTLNYVINLYRLFLVLVPTSICVIYVLVLIEKYKISLQELLIIIVRAGIIQAVFTLIMLISPEVKEILTSIVLKNTRGLSISEIPYWEYQRRYFAFSDCMVDMLGVGAGIITGIAFFLSVVKKNSYLIIAFILLIVPLFNAVTGIVITFIVVLFLLPEFLKRLSLKKIILLCMLSLAVSTFIAVLIINKSESINWVSREVTALLNLKSATKVEAPITSVKFIFEDKFWKFPSNEFTLLFGSGHTVYQCDNFPHSDIGVVNMVWLCGIIGTALLYGAYAYLFTAAYKALSNKSYKALILGISVAFFAFECKGIGITYHPGMPLILLLPFAAIRFQHGGRSK